MLRVQDIRQISMEFVSIEELVPRDHLLRKIDKVINFGFIREKVKDLYCADNGRSAIDPVVLLKMLFIGDLSGTRSKRQLVRDIQVNVAYRWFLVLARQTKSPTPPPSARTGADGFPRAPSIRRSSTRLFCRQCAARG